MCPSSCDPHMYWSSPVFPRVRVCRACSSKPGLGGCSPSWRHRYLGSADVVEDGVTGWVLDPEDHEGMGEPGSRVALRPCRP